MRRGALAFTAVVASCAALLECTGDDPALSTGSDGGGAPDTGSSTDAAANVEAGDGGGDGGVVHTKTVLTTNELQPTAIAASDGTLFWSCDDGTIRTCTAANCASTVKDFAVPAERVDGGYSGASTGTEALLVDATHVYWGAYYTGYIHRCPRAGCAPSGPEKWMNAGPGVSEPTGLAMDDTHVYFTDEAGTNGVWRCAKAQSPCVRELVAPLTTPLPRSLAVGGASDGFLYWLSSGYPGEPPGELAFVKKDATDAAPYASQFLIPSPNTVRVTSANVFYSSESDGDGGANTGAIYKGKTGNQAEATAFATGLGRPGAIALDANDIYWVELGSGRVASCPRAGCAASGPAVIASGEDEPYGLAVDDAFVYWTTRSGGQVKMVSK